MVKALLKTLSLLSVVRILYFILILCIDLALTLVYEEPMGIRHVRRIPHARGSGARTRRSNMQFHSTSTGGGTLAGLTPATRETTDPIAGILLLYNSVFVCGRGTLSGLLFSLH